MVDRKLDVQGLKEQIVKILPLLEHEEGSVTLYHGSAEIYKKSQYDFYTDLVSNKENIVNKDMSALGYFQKAAALFGNLYYMAKENPLINETTEKLKAFYIENGFREDSRPENPFVFSLISMPQVAE